MIDRARRAPFVSLCRTAGIAMLAGSALLISCESASVRAEDAGQREIEAVAAELRALQLRGPDGGPDGDGSGDAGSQRRQSLRALVTRLNGLRDLAPGQQAAANLLAAGIMSNVGQLAADDAQELGRRLRDDRRQLEGRIEAAGALQALAVAGDSFDPAADQARLEALRAEARAQITVLERVASELVQPMAALDESIAENRRGATEIERAEIDLRRRAREAGPIAGFPIVEQASLRRTEADALRLEAARDELELMEIRPERELAELDAAQLRGIVENLETVDGDLTGSVEAARALADAARASIAETRVAIADSIRSIASLDQTIDGLVEEADQAFQESANLAQRATSVTEPRALGTAGRRSVASAHQALAALHMDRAISFRDQAAQLTRIASFGELLDDGAITARLGTVEASRMASIEKAKAAVSAALEQVGQLGSDTPASTLLKSNLTALLDSLSGREVAAATSRASGSGGASGAGANAGAPAGAETPEALLAMLQGIDLSQAAGHAAMVRLYRASSREGRGLLRVIAMNSEECGDLSAAMVEKFGPESLSAGYEGLSITPQAAALEVGEVGTTKGTLRPTAPGTPEVAIVKGGGRWFLDLDAMIDAGGPGMRADVQQLVEMSQAAEAMRPLLREVCAEVAARVRAGEFATPEDVRGAVAEAAMSRAMGGADVQEAIKRATEQLEGLSPEELRKLQEQLGSPR